MLHMWVTYLGPQVELPALTLVLVLIVAPSFLMELQVIYLLTPVVLQLERQEYCLERKRVLSLGKLLNRKDK